MARRYRDWLIQAEADLRHALNSLNAGDYNWACFACQQAAEKALKALYDYLGGEGWGHVVVKLLKELPREKIEVCDELFKKGAYLDKLYIPTRYPNGFVSGSPVDFYTKEEAETAINYARDILSFVKAHIH